MDDRMLAGITEATRLTRAGKLMEATALIQQTLQGMCSPKASSDTTNRPGDEPIDVSFEVIGAEPRHAEGSTRQNNTSSVARLLPLDVTGGSSQENKRAYTKPTNARPNPGEKRHAGAHTTIPGTDSERTKFTPLVPKHSTSLSLTLRPPGSGRGRTVSTPMPNRERSETWVGGQFIDGSYTNQAGNLTYKLYIPSGYSGQALPLVVMLHGCMQNPDDFAVGSRMNLIAEKKPFFVVYPAQATSANPSKCWNWFKPTDQQRGRGEPSIIAGITHQIISTYQIDARRIYVAGLSAGGAMAAIVGMSYPDLYAAIGIHSGLAYGAAKDLPSAFAAMQHGGQIPPRQADICTQLVPTIVFHGDRDTIVHPCNGDQAIAQWTTSEAGRNLLLTSTQQQVSNGRAYTRSIYHDASGRAVMEQWLVHGTGHAWSGGSPSGSFTDAKGPDASQEMIRFFYEHRK
ncbi:esterase, PHB depolymerase family [Pleurocapsa sp. PCC 7327]|uniref:extracellular catalytic domain type 1 short-chain-length polyhydroxyalkanoate depolymerase n=1 Tax=Pleurocapsa sp. PCC 7327 TaxID=118163 RepID=UPI00029FD318|nr:PHB depolymerase family esterase [Pleurocapsa sp. PCC 7327]AFY79027.1 esterase, PHB depolymerase family [Pleurocapsa sp. PCC 7327]